MAEAPHRQGEPPFISATLGLDTLDLNLFRSKANSLFVPIRARGVFGGQVISQALVAATKCVDPAYHLNSMHCYFLLSASGTVPIFYTVDRIRDGRSYCTRSVRAVQKGQTIFTMLCSFQRPEPWQPHDYQMPMPQGLPPPDTCEDTEVIYKRYLKVQKDLKPEFREHLADYIQEREASPLAIRHAAVRVNEEGVRTIMTWFKVRAMAKYPASFQKCILSYISDSQFIGAATKVLHIDRHSEGENRLSMSSTIDHTIWFYDDDFDCGDWLLYVVDTPRARHGRAVVFGRMYTESGKLIAVMTQEGVMRVDIRPPPQNGTVAGKAKL
ncbi:thioesterase-like superfamily-domain-containing protein [Cristinia sonorae]|uniref:Thioesterase-like superfamily-domain-containing protein n=1 Tax=Cristinia sonorae TaxID=1940300 RepID=A0A8K0UQS5_9AGAR|nr:thioesterase-like superfamily-domain-containing protein [Cristinia sonorae]